MDCAQKVFRESWEERRLSVSNNIQRLKKKVQHLETDLGNLISRLVQTDNPRAISAYEARIAELEDKRIVLNEEIAKTSKPKHSFEEMFEHSMHFLSSPYEIWKNGSFEVKRTVIRLVFDGPLIVGANQELRTGKTTYPINMLGTLKGVNSKLVPRGGIEPPTRGFSIHCSTPELPGHRRPP